MKKTIRVLQFLSMAILALAFGAAQVQATGSIVGWGRHKQGDKIKEIII